ncbi:hypothetical protein BC827DRAFT_1158078 [Russula dissimulans]|nr:hypothetical protein BC827DRAFT_1158078 [Russula dissimulans]
MPKPLPKGEAVTPVQLYATSSAHTTRVSVADGLSPLQEIAKVKFVLEGILQFIKETKSLEKEKEKEGPSERMSELSSIHKSIKTDLLYLYTTLYKRLDEILDMASKSLSVVDKVLKGVNVISSSTKDLSREVDKMSATANKIADSMAMYRDAVLKNQTLSLCSNINPITLSDLDRKLRQILIEISDMEGNNILTKSLREIKDKAEGIINSMKDKEKPTDIKVESIAKTRTKAIILTMNSKQSATWLKGPQSTSLF